jgi:hypothetical protein
MTTTFKFNRLILLTILLVTFALLAGCASNDSGRSKRGTAGGVKESIPSLQKRFANIPLPKGYDLDRSRSFIYESGSGHVKVGRLHLTGWGGPDNVINFYRTEMIKKKWNLIRVTEQEATIMLYDQETELCTIVIVKSYGKTSIDIQFGPK